jgi:glycosyltransferase involved in cell wall biosynthesis
VEPIAILKRPRGTFRLSVVVAMYNEEEVCELFFQRVVPILEAATSDYEIVCVNDGSRDRTMDILRAANAKNPRIRVLDLSRNFGKEFALTAGLDYATGDAVVPIDADLQDPPELIPQMIERWREGNDVVLAVREDRSSDTHAKRVTAGLFYKLMGWIGDVSLPPNAGDFRLMDRAVVEALRKLPERTRFLKGLFAWLGFRQSAVHYTRPARAA